MSNLGVAYGIQRKNRKKMANGGVAAQVKSEGAMSARKEMPEPAIQKVGKELYLDEDESASEREAMRDHKMHFAEGGEAKKREGEPYPWKGPNSSSTGVNAPLPNRETAGWHGNSQSEAGNRLRTANKYGPNMESSKKVALEDAKHLHKQTLSELKSMKKPNLYAYGGMADEMPEPAFQRAGMEHSLNEDENMSVAERIRDKHMKMAHGGFASPEYMDAGELGFPMLESENDPDEYSKEGIINYAFGGMAKDEMPEPAMQRLGSEKYLNDLQMPIDRHGMGQGKMEQGRSLSQENPSVADSIRRKFMAQGGYALDEDEAADDNAIEHPNQYYGMSRALANNDMYAEMPALKQVGKASNKNMGSIGYSDFGGDNSDQFDMVSSIRKKYMRDRAMR